jgi:hypothetical protein
MKWGQLARFLCPILLLGLVLSPQLAGADVQLQFTPQIQGVPPGLLGSLSIWLNEPLDIRTIEVWAQYNPDIVVTAQGLPGQLFDDTGCPLFPAFAEETPGTWYAAVVSLGPDCFPTGPGELYRWEFWAENVGVTSVVSLSVTLTQPGSIEIPDVSIVPATVIVALPTDVPTSEARNLELSLYPNPFNPKTQLSFRSPVQEHAEVSVFDLTGRVLGKLWSGAIGPEPTTVPWEGQDANGQPLASGVYVFQITTENGRRIFQKGILLK